MIKHYYINREWIMSATARRIYRASAVISLALPVSLFMVVYSRAYSPGWLPLLRDVTWFCVAAAVLTQVAMEYFLYGFDKSSETKKVFWFFLLLVPLLGCALFCLTVYSRAADADNPAQAIESGILKS